jgi:cytochrome c biogenesis protein CcmG, thiol:disulfide interchange protein DsbE
VNPLKLAIGAAVFLAIIGVLAYEGVRALPSEVSREQAQMCAPLEPDPGWTVMPAKEFSLRDYRGQPVSLSAYRGRVVFLNFWATWCPPCRDEMDSMDRLARELGSRQDFVMLAVSEDKSWDDVRHFFPKGTPMTILMDEDYRIAHSYGTEKLPETYLIDKQGNVRQYVINKRQWDSPQAVACIKSLLD